MTVPLETLRRQAAAGATMGDLIVHALRRSPAQAAFVTAAGTITYGQLDEMITAGTRALASLGIAPQAAVAQLVANRPEAFALQAAAYLTGHPSLMLHPATSRDDLAAVLADAGAQLLAVDGDGPIAAAADEIAASVPGLIIATHDDGPLPALWRAAGAGGGGAGGGGAGGDVSVAVSADSIARLSYTGGTTGRPKGVVLSHRAMVAATVLAAAELEWPAELRFLVATPISHAGGTLVPSVLLKGGTAYLAERFEAARFIEQIRAERITATFVVPTMIGKLLDALAGGRADLPSLGMLLYGGAPMPADRVRAALRAFGPVLVQSYGQAEAPNTISLLKRAEHRPDTLASCGLPYAGVTVSIRDQSGAEVPDGSVGEVCVRGPQLMDGYLGLPELTAETLRGGWLHTGDLGYRGPDGHLFLVARERDVIITGGFNVYPADVEHVLLSQPGVRECVVVGVPDETWGEAVTALVVTDGSVSPEQLRALVRERKGPVLTPKFIRIVEALPLTPLGKPDRRQIRDGFWAAEPRSIR